ncbi:butyrophilin subfamily 3 member A3-like isoform X2 [Acanthochromis polyacanthus]|uniref:butyrophilin subfamily 3 member A3-like isoform X2 n=1 Tax=Acanthochromis polyacanthus TaxID=80966 RepID=UPI002234C5DC|nr:butyrophilin subfamily 3 member A3-like isoform X2 [Acanthochromis polyacanthus]
MVYVKLRQSGASSVLVFHIAVILTQMYSCRGESQVIGPLHPIVALIGEDIILPCYLKPVLNAFAMTVEWARPDLNPRFVLVWRDGLELESEKNPLYSSRTSLFTDELKHGNISLKLSSVKLSDQGTYSCFVPDLDRDSRIQLVAGAASSLVNISEISRNSSAVELECESAGWYPEPEVLWMDGEGNLLSAGPTETVRGPDGLYAVSSRVTVEKRHSNKLTCRVQQNNIKQNRETWIHVPDDFVTDPPPPSPSSSSVAAIIGLIVAIMLTLAVVFFVWKWRQIKLGKSGEPSYIKLSKPDPSKSSC